jgi:demethylmenaquinone methyltransferase/2-methoxy-6-polyprenyl-1,4-benzoquinol methylase
MPSTEQVREMFNQISFTYDRVNRIVSLGQDLRWRRQLARHLPLQPHLTLVDLATGTGDQLLTLFQEGASIQRGVGVDIAAEMLVLARSKFQHSPYAARAEFLQANAEKLPFKSELFDAATFSFGIRNVSNPLQTLTEMLRVLKPKGRALILEFSLPSKLVRPFFLFYLRRILPWLGRVFSKNPSAYRYLNQTIESFYAKEDFLQLMKKAGFSKVRACPMNFGSVILYIGEK